MTRRPRALSEADRALWARVAETVAPLGRAGRTAPPPAEAQPAARPAAGAVAPSAPAATAPPLRAPLRRLELPARPEPPARWHAHGAERPRPPGPATPGLDRNTARRLARGQREPEARLDLHGLSTDRAHSALVRFVADSAQAGLRCVLVVTGLGRGEDGRGRGEGVLRRETPRWLSVPPVSGLVVGVFEAHPRHGGAGALYVYLKRQR